MDMFPQDCQVLVDFLDIPQFCCAQSDQIRCDANHRVTHLQLNNANHYRNGTNTTAILNGLVSLSFLETLAISGVEITGNMPETVGQLSSLKRLYVINTSLKGSLPEMNLGNLEVLTIRDNPGLHGDLPSFEKMKTLNYVEITKNEFSGRLPSPIMAKGLDGLLLAGNRFTGPVPSSLCDLQFIRSLDLSSNHIRGTIPPCIGNLELLEKLWLGNNSLVGTIPNFESLSNLQSLRLNKNNLIGAIPVTIGNLRRLKELDLSSNHLIGPVPSSLDQLRNLEYLFLDNNCVKDQMYLKIVKENGALRFRGENWRYCTSIGMPFGTIPGTDTQVSCIIIIIAFSFWVIFLFYSWFFRTRTYVKRTEHYWDDSKYDHEKEPLMLTHYGDFI